jgi:hypothetical protein
MPARINRVIDAVVQFVAGQWVPSTPDSVERQYLAPFELEKMTGRRVVFFPARYLNNPADRESDEFVYSVAAVVAEKYSAAGEPTRDWVDERVEFVDQLNDWLDLSREPLEFGAANGRRLITQSASVEVYDADLLNTKKIFWSELALEFREIEV